MNKENTITVSHDRRWFCLNDGGIDPSRASLSYYTDDAVSSRRILYIHLGEFLVQSRRFVLVHLGVLSSQATSAPKRKLPLAGVTWSWAAADADLKLKWPEDRYGNARCAYILL